MKRVEEIVDITWLDATGQKFDDENVGKIQKMTDGREFLSVKHTYGRLIKENKYVVAVMTEECKHSDQNEITVIPRGWVTAIDRYRKVR